MVPSIHSKWGQQQPFLQKAASIKVGYGMALGFEVYPSIADGSQRGICPMRRTFCYVPKRIEGESNLDAINLLKIIAKGVLLIKSVTND